MCSNSNCSFVKGREVYHLYCVESMIILIRKLHVLKICRLAMKLPTCLFGIRWLVVIVTPNFDAFPFLKALYPLVKAFLGATQIEA